MVFPLSGELDPELDRTSRDLGSRLSGSRRSNEYQMALKLDATVGLFRFKELDKRAPELREVIFFKTRDKLGNVRSELAGSSADVKNNLPFLNFKKTNQKFSVVELMNTGCVIGFCHFGRVCLQANRS